MSFIEKQQNEIKNIRSQIAIRDLKISKLEADRVKYLTTNQGVKDFAAKLGLAFIPTNTNEITRQINIQIKNPLGVLRFQNSQALKSIKNKQRVIAGVPPFKLEDDDKTDFKVDIIQLAAKKLADRIEREQKVKAGTSNEVVRIVEVGSGGGQIGTS